MNKFFNIIMKNVLYYQKNIIYIFKKTYHKPAKKPKKLVQVPRLRGYETNTNGAELRGKGRCKHWNSPFL